MSTNRELLEQQLQQDLMSDITKLLASEYTLAQSHIMAYLSEPIKFPGTDKTQAAPHALRLRLDAMREALNHMDDALRQGRMTAIEGATAHVPEQ